MVSQNVDKLLQQAKSLSLEEREQFIELLKRQSHGEGPPSREDELAAALAKKGIRLTVPPKRTPEEIERFRAWKPIEMPGLAATTEFHLVSADDELNAAASAEGLQVDNPNLHP